MRRSKFQSPCAGNMFGKLNKIRRMDVEAFKTLFQSPCAGNMFGKAQLGYLTRNRSAWVFQSPCAGNMFGKGKREIKRLLP